LPEQLLAARTAASNDDLRRGPHRGQEFGPAALFITAARLPLRERRQGLGLFLLEQLLTTQATATDDDLGDNSFRRAKLIAARAITRLSFCEVPRLLSVFALELLLAALTTAPCDILRSDQWRSELGAEGGEFHTPSRSSAICLAVSTAARFTNSPPEPFQLTAHLLEWCAESGVLDYRDLSAGGTSR
jgi:hypothetical protein